MDLHSKGSIYLTILAIALLLLAVSVLAQVCPEYTTCPLSMVVEFVQDVWQRPSSKSVHLLTEYALHRRRQPV